MWRAPHEQVIALVERFKGRGINNICDLGCGAGRHLVYLAQEGFESYGLDISKTALDYARSWLDQAGLRAALTQGDISEIPYSEAAFDALISTYVIYHNRLEGIKRTISEIHRVLRDGGLVLLTFQSKRSWKYGRGEEVEPDTFISDVGLDSGELHHYSDHDEIESLLSEFTILEIDLDELTDEQGNRHSHWAVVVEKS
ncbi:MAG: class I SAM-dependent methyltransferase [Candidatus Bipolaricaulia bacterium]